MNHTVWSDQHMEKSKGTDNLTNIELKPAYIQPRKTKLTIAFDQCRNKSMYYIYLIQL